MSDARKIDDGGPAFPTMTDGGWAFGGMTRRQWYAGMALAHPYTMHESNTEKVAEWAFNVADAMIAREKSETGQV